MLNWIRSLFTRLDRGDVAAERIAVALEDIATDLEAARDALRGRLGTTATTTPAVEPQDHVEPARNGKARRIAV